MAKFSNNNQRLAQQGLAKREKSVNRLARLQRAQDNQRIRQENATIRAERLRGVSIAALVIVVLLAVSVISSLVNGEPKTFYGLLEVMQNVPSADFGWLNFGEVALNLPDWLSFLEVIVQVLSNLLAVLGFLLAGIIQAITFILYFLRWVFL